MDTKNVMSSQNHTWATPPEFLEAIRNYFGVAFELDAAAMPHTTKALHFYTPEDDALTKDWNKPTVWLNPPYGRTLYTWLKYAQEQQAKHNNRIFVLVPARPDTKWFHEVAVKGKIYFLKSRVKFLDGDTNKPSGSPAFPSMLVIFDGEAPVMTTWEWEKWK